MSRLSELTSLLDSLAGKRPGDNPGFVDDLNLQTKRNVKIRNQHRYSPELIAQIRELYKKGYKIKDITKTLGIHHTCIYDVVGNRRTKST